MTNEHEFLKFLLETITEQREADIVDLRALEVIIKDRIAEHYESFGGQDM